MKIAILSPTFSPFAGLDRVVERQAKELAQSGNDITILTLKAYMPPPERIKLEVLGMPKSPLWQRVYMVTMPLNICKALKWVPRLKGFDVIYSHHYPMNWLAYLAKKFYSVKYIYYNHTIASPEAFSSLIERSYMRLFISLANWTIKRADSAISISCYVRQQLIEQTGLVSEVVYNKIDTTRFHGELEGSRLRDKYELGSSPIILFVGRLSPPKGVHLLIEAFSLIKQQIPDAKLIIVGEHTLPYYLKRLRKMVNPSVIFAGYVTDEEIPYYYAACDVYATGTMCEGFNLPLVEAQACGKPVVAFNIGPHPEVVKDGETGFLVPPRDVGALAEAVIRLIKNDKLRQEIGKNASKWVKGKFS